MLQANNACESKTLKHALPSMIDEFTPAHSVETESFEKVLCFS